MTGRRERARAAEASSDPDTGDDVDITGMFGILRMVLGPAINATKRAPQPIRRILWGKRPPA